MSDYIYGQTPFSLPTAVSGTIKASAGFLYSFRGENRNAAIRYLQFWDGALGGTGTLKATIEIPGGSVVLIDRVQYGQNGLKFPTSILYGFSTAATTYSAGTASDHTLEGVYA